MEYRFIGQAREGSSHMARNVTQLMEDLGVLIIMRLQDLL